MNSMTTTSASALPFMQEHEIAALSLCLRRFTRPVKALEWGSGRSTLYLAPRLPHGSMWTSVEHDQQWYEQVNERIRTSGHVGISLYNIPPEPSYRDWRDDELFRCFSRYVLFPSKLASRFDFMLVDGRARVECMALGWDLLEDDGIMALHDAWREEYQPGIPAGSFQVRISIPADDRGFPAAILLMAKRSNVLAQLLRELRRELPASVSITDNLGPAVPATNRILFINTCYTGFLKEHYRQTPQLAEKKYYWQKRSLNEQCFGDSDFYSSGMIAAGWDSDDIVINCPELQSAWGSEIGIPCQDAGLIALEQVRRFEPDVVYLQDLGLASTAFLDRLRPHTRLIAGQIASPLPPHADLSGIDILFSSFPHFVRDFKQQGTTAWYQPLAFEPRVLQRLPDMERIYPATFVGGMSPHHGKGLDILQNIAELVPVDFWGYGSAAIPPESPILQRHHGEAWGLDMFAILRQSAITLNRHIDVAGDCANNMRLFEATGCGALLITDYRYNLNDLFEIGKEIVAYRSPEEAAALIRYYQANPEEAAAIAKAGQERTLRDHTYTRRMEQTAEILGRHLRYQREQGRYPLPKSISSNYRPISPDDTTEAMTQAWKDKGIPARQRGLVQMELEQMYAGQIKPHFAALADLIRPIIRDGSSVLELGCASGYYYEILEYLLGRRIKYIGVDYSEAMIAMAREYYPRPEFFAADAKSLFFADRQFDLVISSSVLLHVPNYRQHIEEAARVAGEWIVAHRTPVCRASSTRRMAKQAYGVETVEFCFNEQEFLQLFSLQGFEVVAERLISEMPDRDEYCVSYLMQRTNSDKLRQAYCTNVKKNKNSKDYLSVINDIKNKYLDGFWSFGEQQYVAPDGIDGTLRPLTWLNVFIVQTIAILANQGLASKIDIYRASSVIDKLISSPCYINNTWTHLMDGSSDQHPALDQTVAESLYYAWKYHAALGLHSNTVDTIYIVLTQNKPVSSRLYHSGFNLTPDLTLVDNQNYAKWQYNRITYAYLAGATEYAKELEVTIKQFLNYYFVPEVLFSDFGWFYYSGMDMWHSFEYGAMVAGGASLFYPDICRAVNLDNTEVSIMRAWNRHIFGMWQRNGYPNWDTVFSSGRIHQLSYWLWALRSLIGMARSPELCQESGTAAHAKFMLDNAIDTFTSMDTWQRDPADSVVSNTPFGISEIGIFGQQYNNVKATGVAKFVMELGVAVDLGVADAESADPGNVWGWNWMSMDVHVSTPTYSAASLPYSPQIGVGPWNSVADSVQSPGDGVSRIQLPTNEILTSLGGYNLESFSFVIVINGITEINTGSMNAGRPVSQQIWVDEIPQLRTDYDTSIIPSSFCSVVRTLVIRNGANYQSQVETFFYSGFITQGYKAVLTGTSGVGQVIHSFPCRKNVVIDYVRVSGEKTVIWDGTTIITEGSPSPSLCKYIHLKWATNPDSTAPAGIMLIPTAGSVAVGAKVTVMSYEPSGHPRRQPDQDRSLLIYLADNAASMGEVSLTYDIIITDGTDAGAISAYSAGGYSGKV